MKCIPIGFKSDYSLLKSILKIKDIIAYAKDNNSSYAGILDDNPYAIMDFYDKCEKENLKPICGVIVKIGDNKIYLYLQNYVGYLNIIKINELVNDKKLTINDLIKYNEGLLAVLPYENYNMFNRLKNSFDVYLGYKNEFELKNAYQISKNVLFINEIYYLKKEESGLLSILYKIADDNYKKDENYVLEMSEFDSSTIESFVSKIDLKFEFNKRYIPQFCNTKEESYKLLCNLSIKGLKKRLNGNVTDIYKKRLKYELDVISKMGFVDYFLIVYDYVLYAKKNDIMAAPRGSAAGSLVSYTLGITDIDPIKYDLLFERFLNPERVTMPDIDMDFEDIRRNDVIEYVKKKYGEKFVSLIVAYGTLGSRQVVRDVGKVLGIEEKIISGLSKLIDPKDTLKNNISKPELLEYIKSNKLEKMYKVSMRLEGLKKHTTIHAAGVVISSIPLSDIIPTFKVPDGLLTGYTMEYLEKLGLLKMDFLAVRNLTIIHNTLNLVKSKHNNFNLENIPLDDLKTYKLLGSGNTDGIFQFETPGMRNFVKKLEPENFDDLTAAIALFRPGPMKNIDEYISRRKGKKVVQYLHPDLKPILSSTYGIIIYQEQIMQILSKMGGYTFAEADLIRRAMSKKKKEVMEKEKVRFVEGAIKKGYTSSLAEEVYELILRFADYGFNKSHSVAYALIGYRMAYLKANFNDEVQINTLNMNLGSEAKTKDVIEEAKNKGLKIVKPNINESSYEFIMKDNSIILPLSTIKNISRDQSKTIVDNKPYNDFFDFFKKTKGKNIKRDAIETLIKGGAFDIFGYSKNTLLSNIDSALTYIELTDSLGDELIMKPELEVSNEPDIELSEIDIFGFYVSGHPAMKFKMSGITKLNSMDKYIKRRIDVIALVDAIKVIETKKKEKMAFVSISDDTKKCEGVIFPRNNSLIEKIKEGELYKITGLIEKRESDFQLIIDNIELLENK